MPTVLADPASSQSHIPLRKNNFKTVLGLGIAFKPTDPHPPATLHPLARNSVDTTRTYRSRRTQRTGWSNITDPAFYSSQDKPPFIMRKLDPPSARPFRRHPVRINTQNGPWSLSVAETPHDASSYSIYIKTPTHNLTLTRTAMEIVQLHQKLCEVLPNADFPSLPIDINSYPSPPPKRKSTFFYTLSRLASPTSTRSARHARPSTASILPSNPPITLSPLASPSTEGFDPFIHVESVAPATTTPPAGSSATITRLAAYLTAISNMTGVRQARVWKRFIRVRTDDLESVRAERAIKRMRSDLASHLSPTVATETNPDVTTNGSGDANSIVNGADRDFGPEEAALPPTNDGEQEEDGISAALKEDAAIARAVVEDLGFNDIEPDSALATDTSAPEQAGNGVPKPPTPVRTKQVVNGVKKEEEEVEEEAEEKFEASLVAAGEVPVGRMQRSQSADPDKARRLSRTYTSRTTQNMDGTTTGDEASISTSEKRRGSTRTKRCKSVDPKKKSQRKVVVDDFEMMRVLGKGCAGKVLLVRRKSTGGLYALKAITKRHVLAHQELQHTLTEQAVLKRMAAEATDPFVVKLWWSFHDKENLFLVMDFHPGGDLATQLARWGRLGRDRARFYAAEIVEGVEGLHAAGVIYRDLKPENILIGADGHIVLTDFGLSKEFPRRNGSSGFRSEFYSLPGTPQTPPWAKSGGDVGNGAWPGHVPGPTESTSTFCGTAEYLAPEVIQGSPYSFEVDWWSFGTMLYEMLTGITPFWASNHSDMYVRVLQDELQFPDDRSMDQDTKSLIRGLLQRNPALRICEPRIKRHPYFSMIDWSHVYYKRYIPPYIPPIDPHNASDTQNFDDTFLDMEPVLDDANDHTDTDQEREQTDTDRTDGDETNTTPSQSRSSSVQPRLGAQQQQQQHHQQDDSVDVFDGYSFKGRHSVLIDGEESEEESEEEADAVIGDSRDDLGDLAEDRGVAGDLEEESGEPKTPEARPSMLPEPEPEPEVKVEPATLEVTEPPPIERPVEEDSFDIEVTEVMEVPRRSVDLTPVAEELSTKPKSGAPSKIESGARLNHSANKTRTRREKSGVPALDRYLSDTIDEDATEREDEDDDWDIVEAADGEDRNEYKGTNLFARGVVDRYRLAVFRKVSTPSRKLENKRSVSGRSKEPETTDGAPVESPSPPEKRRRGRNPGLNFRKSPRQFLRAKSPAPPPPPPSSVSLKMTTNLSAASTVSSNTGLLTPSQSNMDGDDRFIMSPSLKSKESAISVGTQSLTSDHSGNGDTAATTVPHERPAQAQADTVLRNSPPEETEKPKAKKLKKYKENAEKVFSLFGASPRTSP